MVRWVLLIHGDSDGICSGGLALHYFSLKGYDVYVYFTHPAGLYNDILEFTRNGDNLFIADIAINEAQVDELLKILGERSRYGEVIYIDHHPEPLEIKPGELPVSTVVHDTCCSASELTYRFFEKHGVEHDYSRVALYGAIGDYVDETPWVRRALWDWDKRSVYYEAGVLIQGIEGSRKQYDFKRDVVKLLSVNKLPSSDQELLKRAVEQSVRDEELRLWVKTNLKVFKNISYVAEPPGSVGRAANYARVYGGTKVGLAYEVKGETLVMSVRSANGIDLNKILRRITKTVGGSGGGHPNAAGARVRVDKFRDFLELLSGSIAE